ncbi:MAG: hypothetical protein Q7K98_06560 [Candidatus Omnitrophota bacterium]|nr:hypothetical protein [Candidatus Omnitrophota bacterium]
MRNELIEKAVNLGQELGYVFLTTADDMYPHLTVATKIGISPKGQLSVAGWFCPGTVMNLKNKAGIGVIVWDKERDVGYQLLGKREDLREIAILDGYDRKLEKEEPSPQAERELVINVEKVLEFKKAPHSDLEEH